MVECMKNMAKKPEFGQWIPVSEGLPKDDKYILISYENFALAGIGRYETDNDGNGAFYIGDEDRGCVSFGLFVNAWMPLPEPYRERKAD